METLLIDDTLLERYENLVALEEMYEEGEDISFNVSYSFIEEEVQLCKEIYGKSDIKILLACEDDKALRFLKVLFQMKYAIKIGKEYYIKKSDFDDFFANNLGKSIAI